MSVFQIINQILDVEFTAIDVLEHWKNFYYNGSMLPHIRMRLIHTNKLNRDIEYVPMIGYEHMLVLGKSLMFADRDYRQFYIFNPSGAETFETFAAYAFYTHAIRRQILWIHSATIQVGNVGVLFLGPSGIGKTTQAELWKRYQGAEIINGDVGFVQRTPEGYVAWGTPWHGSSPYCENASVPVKALVVLKQAPENALRLLTGFEKVMEVSRSILHPTWLEDGVERCAELMNSMLNDLPVYRLDNRADEEAVQLLAEEIDRITGKNEWK